MRLSTSDLTFTLNVSGYQFPEIEDSDWLNIRVALSHAEERRDRWEKVDPSLTTFEVQWLVEWLEEVAAHAEIFKTWRSQRLTSRIFFTEPNLGFEALSGSTTGKALTLRVYLAAEILPPFKNDLDQAKLDDDPSEIWIDFSVDTSELEQAAHSLTQQLAMFPVRVGLPKHPPTEAEGV